MYQGGKIEKRKSPRLECSMPVQYKKVGETESEENTALTKDISREGARLVIEDYIEINSRLALILSFPFKNKRVKTFSKVVWTKRHSVVTRYDVGIEFLGITESARKEIEKFVRTKLL